MSDHLDIRSSGTAAIDTASLRGAAGVGRGIATQLREIGHPLRLAASLVASTEGVRGGRELNHDLLREARCMDELAQECEQLCAALDRSADIYELVDVHATWIVSSAGGAQRDRLEARAGQLGERLWGTPRAEVAFAMIARRDIAGGGNDGEELRAQAAFGAGLIGGAFAAPIGFALVAGLQAAATRASTLGARPTPGHATARVTPTPDVRVIPLRRGSVAPVGGFARAATRISGAGDTRVRVERYVLPGGRREWAVYITGTQAASFDGVDPFDMGSNVALYDGRDAPATSAVRQALAHAGVAPGESVHAFAHSQGAMVAEALARECDYDIETVVTFGSPTAGPLPDHVTAIAVRHTDDPVVALAGPLPDRSRGRGEGFVVQRLADPLPGLHDLTMPAHDLTSYAYTGELMDASADPRVRALDPLWERLAAAESARATDYGARRLNPSAAGAGE